jgi:hypothetical protein
MTGAQRPAAYRERLRAASVDVTVTENTRPTAEASNHREVHSPHFYYLKFPVKVPLYSLYVVAYNYQTESVIQ